MADTVKVRLMVGAREGAAGEEHEVAPARARQLIAGGVARPATKPAAKKVGADPESAVTAQKQSSKSDG